MADYYLDPKTLTPSNPLLNIAKGYELYQGIQSQKLQTEALQRKAQQEIGQQSAMQQYAQTGETAGLKQFTTPQQALGEPERQLKLANEVVKYWDNSKWTLTKDTYPQWRAETMRRFPGIDTQFLPPPETFKTEKEFEDWKTKPERMAAELKAKYIRPVAAGGSVWDPQSRTWMSPPAKPETPLEQAKIRDIESKIEKRGKPGEDKPTKLTNYGTFKQDYLKEHPGAMAVEIRTAWTTSGKKGKEPTKRPQWPSGGTPPPATTFETLPDPAQYTGRTLNQGKYKSDGKQWTDTTTGQVVQ